MKHFLNQVMSAAGALLCVLAFWAAAALKTNDAIAQVVITIVPSTIGLYLGFRNGLHGLTLPLYSFVMMMALAYARVYPYYSTDWHWRGPSMLYTLYLAPSAMLPVMIVVVLRALMRRKRPDK